MRKLFIRFNEGSTGVIREINESRNYYLAEAEQVVEKIRKRLEKEKRELEPKPFELWLNGERIVVTSVNFNNNLSIEALLLETVENSSWDDETKHKVKNSFSEYAEKERELFLSGEFKMFAERFDQLYGAKSPLNQFPFILEIDLVRDLYVEMSNKIVIGYYSELESVMESIGNGLKTITNLVQDELRKVELKDFEDLDPVSFLEVRVKTWLGNENNFRKFKQFVSADYSSVSISRINALLPRFRAYQDLMQKMYADYAFVLGFGVVYDQEQIMLMNLTNKYNDVLFNGFVIANDEMVESLIISPVIEKVNATLIKMVMQKKKERKVIANAEVTEGVDDVSDSSVGKKGEKTDDEVGGESIEEHGGIRYDSETGEIFDV